jgi:type II secretory ATPase GspE/PulE/Tfp pilus assembly ATPase PilB-like protein/GAF domain-containing protein
MEETQVQTDQETQDSRNGAIAKSVLARVRASKNINDHLPAVIDEIKAVFQCSAVTLFGLDRENRQLYSHTPAAEPPGQRFDISVRTLVGYVAATGKSMTTTANCTQEDLAKYHPQLCHGSTLDEAMDAKAAAVMAIALPHNGKLVGVMEIIAMEEGSRFTEEDFKLAREISPAMGLAVARLDETSGLTPANGKSLAAGQGKGISPATQVDGEGGELCVSELDATMRSKQLKRICETINSAKNIDQELENLKEIIMELFEASMITIYAFDSSKNEIFSRIKSADRLDEIRLVASPQSISGWVAFEQKPVNISNVNDEDELQAIHPDLRFDSAWDKISGHTTISMLCHPLKHQGKLIGILQLMNKKGTGRFSAEDEVLAATFSDSLSRAIHKAESFTDQKPTKFSYLVNNGFISQEELNATIAKARQNQVDVETVLLGILGLQRKELGKSLEAYYNLPYFGFSDSIILPKEVLSGLNKSFLSKNHWLPLSISESKVTILTNDPYNPDKYQNIKLIFPKKEIEFKVGLKVDIIDFLNSILGEEDLGREIQKSEAISSLLTTLEGEQSLIDLAGADQFDDGASSISETDSAIVRLVNKIMTDAYDRGVSDIHIEPGIGRDKVTVRFRKDGDCRIYEEIPAIYKQAVISRIKIMAKLDIAERRMPQDGKIKMKYGKKTIEYRVATCPTVGGNEDAVLRILSDSKPIPLEEMHFSERNLELIKEKIAKPYGLVLVVGPTGSGKTTTLHSCLGFINTPNRKIWTAEDPVEITQKGLRQVQMLNKIGLNFARAMRSFLRGDPDVIMVGEMRDTETAAIGLEASLTGHLVMSTLHTNSAPETIVRLLDMGMNPLNFADALLLIVAQRLVRTFCPDCKAEYHPSREEYDTLVKQYGEEAFAKLKIKYDKNLKLTKATGCYKCADTGYAGRLALHELVEGTPELKRTITKNANVEELRNQAIADGMVTLKQDGIQKVLAGHCDLKSVLSVCIL